MSKRQSAQGASDCLVNLIIALLAPMFLWSCKGDVALARAAATETLNAYCVADNLTLVRAAKVLAFDLATLSSLSLSMFDEASAALALRLRGNAVSLDRAAERNRDALEQERRDAAIVAQMADVTEADVMASVQEAQRLVREAQARLQPAPPRETASSRPAPQAVSPAPAASPAPSAPAAAAVRPPMTAPQRQTAPAGVMAGVEMEMTAGLTGLSPAERAGLSPAERAGLSPAERAADLMRIAALTRTASALSSGTALPPYLAAASVSPPAGR